MMWVRSMQGHRPDAGLLEMVQPIFRLAPALARDGSGPCCHDCQAADTLYGLFRRDMATPPLHHAVARALRDLPEAAGAYMALRQRRPGAPSLHALSRVRRALAPHEAAQHALHSTNPKVPWTEPCTEAIDGLTWPMLRLAVGNDRREQLRLAAPMGLAYDGTMAMSEAGDMQWHHEWMAGHGLL